MFYVFSHLPVNDSALWQIAALSQIATFALRPCHSGSNRLHA